MNKPTVFFDLETTGTDIAKDRIVSYHFVKMDGKEILGEISDLVSPGMPIPEESTEIHGITDEMVKNKATFSGHAQKIVEFIKDSNLGGYNIMKFDIPMLAEELLRANVNLELDEVQVIDVCNMFRNLLPHTLEFAHKFYVGETHEGAHEAGADVRATISVMNAMVLKHSAELDSVEKIVELSKPNGNSNFADYAGKLAYNDAGDVVFTFGKNKDKLVKDNLDYADWMLRSDFAETTKMVLRKIINR